MLKKLALAVLTGLILILSFPGFSLWFLAWIALLPLIIISYEENPRTSFLLGWCAGTVFFLGLTYWLLVLYPLINFLAILAWIALSLFQGLFIGVFACGASIIRKNFVGWGRLFAIPAWWVSIEFLRSNGWLGFSWGVLGYSQQPFVFLTQTASITGVYGISFIILMADIALTELILGPKEKVKASLAYSAVVLIILFGMVGSGFIALNNSGNSEVKEIQKQQQAKVALVQGNIPQEEKWDPANEDNIKNIYYDLVQKAGRSKPYLVILPESATPSFLLRDDSYLHKLRSLAKKYGFYLLTGSLDLDNQSKQYNSAILISPRGEAPKKYDKQHLVLFGEYIPFDFIGDIFKNFEKLSWIGESITPGKDDTVFSTSKGKLSTVICFESGDPGLCRRMINKGARLLIVITNDAWFGKSSAADQHMQISAFRAIENGVYLVQVANTGISAIVDPQGRILRNTSLFKREVLQGTVFFKKASSFYLHWGDVFAYICLLVATGFFGAAWLKRPTKD